MCTDKEMLLNNRIEACAGPQPTAATGADRALDTFISVLCQMVICRCVF